MEIQSGRVVYELTRESLDRPLDGRIKNTLKVIFDENKKWCEQIGREYSYVLMGPNAASVTDKKRQELGLDREQAVAAGLLRGFTARYVTVFDGDQLMRYSMHGDSGRADIDDGSGGSFTHVFDPRIMGLTDSLALRKSVEYCLTTDGASAINIIGSDSIHGAKCWGIEVKFQDSWRNRQFWVAEEDPARVMRYISNSAIVTSKYDANDPSDVLPIEAEVIQYPDDPERKRVSHYRRLESQFNVEVDPQRWTLAGLGMEIGVPVIDNRISRRIGYWDGSGLSESPKPSAATSSLLPDKTKNAVRLFALASEDPQSAFAFEASKWIALNSPDGPMVDRSFEILVSHHARGDYSMYFFERLQSLRHGGTDALLEAVLKENPDNEQQGAACLALGLLAKESAGRAGSKEIRNRAEKFLERVIHDYSDVRDRRGAFIHERANDELRELRRLGIGRVAAEIVGVDLRGERMRLSDYRGNVVVINFWGAWCGPCMALIPEERKLVAAMAGRPFALIGVNSDGDERKLQKAIEDHGITWPSFRDGRNGTIAKEWNVTSWPTTYVLDAQGRIRFRDIQGAELARAVESLLATHNAD